MSRLQETVIRGATFHYVDEGQGIPVVYVHGMASDHRYWNAQLQAVSPRARCIAYDQRYFGTTDWPNAGPEYCVATHAEDLANFVKEVIRRPAHIVATSYGGGVALAMAVAHPKWAKSLCLHEPAALPSVISDPEHLAAIANEQTGMAAIADAVKNDERLAAVKQAIEWAEGIPGSFESLADEVQQIFLENAHTLKPHLSRPPLNVTCAQLRTISAPITLMWGANTRPFFAIFAEAIRPCLLNVQIVVLPNARHLAPVQNPDLITRQVLAHLERCGAAAT